MRINKTNTLNFLIILIPLSLVIGNTAVNINIAIICLAGLYFYRFDLFKVEEKVFGYFIFLFFLYLFLITLFKNYYIVHENNKLLILKSFFFFRFLLLLLIINKLIEHKDFNINLFINITAIIALIVSFDILFQFFFKKNLFGYPIVDGIDGYVSGFFKSENIAGGFIQKFSLFSIFSFGAFIYLKKKNKINFFYMSLLIFFIIFSIILTKNRMPLIIFFASLCLFLLMEKKFKYLITLISLFFLIIIVFYKFSIFPNLNLKVRINNFYSSSFEILLKGPKLFLTDSDEIKINDRSTGYLMHFNSGIQVWKKNKITGGGIKSFRTNCIYSKTQTCNTHPHNYMIEILVDTGLIGLILIYICFLIAIKNFVKAYSFSNNNWIKLRFIPFFLILFFEFFPIRSTGSFFTTQQATLIFFILATVLNSKKILIEKYFSK